MSHDWSKDILHMHQHYKINEIVDEMDEVKLRKFLEFRIRFLQEELDEMKNANNAEDVVDALIDICVVAIGTLDSFNIDSYKAWNTVFKANMNKKVGVKKERPNPLGLPDLIKPENWKPPSHENNHGTLSKIFNTR